MSRRLLLAIASLLFANLAAADQNGAPQLALVATYDTGLGVEGAEIISIRHTDGMAALTNAAGSVDVLDLSDPFHPQRLHRVAATAAAPSRRAST